MAEARISAQRRGLAVALVLCGALTAVIGSCAATGTPSPPPGPLTWQKWQHLGGVFDLGVQPDGAGLIAAGSEVLFKVDRAGGIAPITGVASYRKSGGFEAYFAVSNGEPAGGACRFQHGAVYVIDQKTPGQVLEVDPNTGSPKLFASVRGVDTLNGIAFDGTGSFGDHPLLVAGPRGGRSELAAIDCHGDVMVVTDKAPTLEGGIAVAPAGFGGHGGELVAPDEISGDIIGVNHSGAASTLASYKQLIGGDLGVESAAFVPHDFLTNGGFVYLADRATANNPHPGTDSILRLAASQLAATGVHEGDLLVATEGGGTTIDVSCAATCSVRLLASGPPTAHIEGHIVFLNNAPGVAPSGTPPAAAQPSPTPSRALGAAGNATVGAALAASGVIVLLVAVVLVLRRRAAG
jgi:hypothetical protein